LGGFSNSRDPGVRHRNAAGRELAAVEIHGRGSTVGRSESGGEEESFALGETGGSVVWFGDAVDYLKSLRGDYRAAPWLRGPDLN
jgi:hypothetical protein